MRACGELLPVGGDEAHHRLGLAGQPAPEQHVHARLVVPGEGVLPAADHAPCARRGSSRRSSRRGRPRPRPRPRGRRSTAPRRGAARRCRSRAGGRRRRRGPSRAAGPRASAARRRGEAAASARPVGMAGEEGAVLVPVAGAVAEAGPEHEIVGDRVAGLGRERLRVQPVARGGGVEGAGEERALRGVLGGERRARRRASRQARAARSTGEACSSLESVYRFLGASLPRVACGRLARSDHGKVSAPGVNGRLTAGRAARAHAASDQRPSALAPRAGGGRSPAPGSRRRPRRSTGCARRRARG